MLLDCQIFDQGEAVDCMEFSEVLGAIKVSSRPLRLGLRRVDGAGLCFSPVTDREHGVVNTGLAVRKRDQQACSPARLLPPPPPRFPWNIHSILCPIVVVAAFAIC
jgi:hypothetical protein